MMNKIEKQTKKMAFGALMCSLMGLGVAKANGMESSKIAHFIEICDTVKTQKTPTDSAKTKETKVWSDPYSMPSFRGGTKALLEWINENLRYPEELADSCIQGRVIVTFIINEDGTVSDGKVVRSLHPLLDAEALRLVSIMPRWSPYKLNGKAQKNRYTMPVIFKLQ
jgi:TonB family protein